MSQVLISPFDLRQEWWSLVTPKEFIQEADSLPKSGWTGSWQAKVISSMSVYLCESITRRTQSTNLGYKSPFIKPFLNKTKFTKEKRYRKRIYIFLISYLICFIAFGVWNLFLKNLFKQNILTVVFSCCECHELGLSIVVFPAACYDRFSSSVCLC